MKYLTAFFGLTLGVAYTLQALWQLRKSDLTDEGESLRWKNLLSVAASWSSFLHSVSHILSPGSNWQNGLSSVNWPASLFLYSFRSFVLSLATSEGRFWDESCNKLSWIYLHLSKRIARGHDSLWRLHLSGMPWRARGIERPRIRWKGRARLRRLKSQLK